MKKPVEIVKEITSKFGGYYCDVKSQLEAEFIAAIQADRDEREKVTNERDMYIRKCDDLGTEAQRDESKNWQELANGWQQQSNKFESERDQLKAQLNEAVKLLPRLRAHICELTRVREKYVDARGNEDFRETVAEIDSVLAKVKGEK